MACAASRQPRRPQIAREDHVRPTTRNLERQRRRQPGQVARLPDAGELGQHARRGVRRDPENRQPQQAQTRVRRQPVLRERLRRRARARAGHRPASPRRRPGPARDRCGRSGSPGPWSGAVGAAKVEQAHQRRSGGSGAAGRAIGNSCAHRAVDHSSVMPARRPRASIIRAARASQVYASPARTPSGAAGRPARGSPAVGGSRRPAPTGLPAAPAARCRRPPAPPDGRQVGRDDRGAGRHVVEQLERRGEVAGHQIVGQRQDGHAGPGDGARTSACGTNPAKLDAVGDAKLARPARGRRTDPDRRRLPRPPRMVRRASAARPSRPAACRRLSSGTTGRRTPPCGWPGRGRQRASRRRRARPAPRPCVRPARQLLLQDLGARLRERQQQVGLARRRRLRAPAYGRQRPDLVRIERAVIARAGREDLVDLVDDRASVQRLRVEKDPGQAWIAGQDRGRASASGARPRRRRARTTSW